MSLVLDKVGDGKLALDCRYPPERLSDRRGPVPALAAATRRRTGPGAQAAGHGHFPADDLHQPDVVHARGTSRHLRGFDQLHPNGLRHPRGVAHGARRTLGGLVGRGARRQARAGRHPRERGDHLADGTRAAGAGRHDLPGRGPAGQRPPEAAPLAAAAGLPAARRRAGRRQDRGGLPLRGQAVRDDLCGQVLRLADKFPQLWVARSVLKNTGDQPIQDYRVRFRLAEYATDWGEWHRCADRAARPDRGRRLLPHPGHRQGQQAGGPPRDHAEGGIRIQASRRQGGPRRRHPPGRTSSATTRWSPPACRPSSATSIS